MFFYFKCSLNIFLDGILTRGKRQMIDRELYFVFNGRRGANFFFKRVLYAKNVQIFSSRCDNDALQPKLLIFLKF